MVVDMKEAPLLFQAREGRYIYLGNEVLPNQPLMLRDAGDATARVFPAAGYPLRAAVSAAQAAPVESGLSLS